MLCASSAVCAANTNGTDGLDQDVWEGSLSHVGFSLQQLFNQQLSLAYNLFHINQWEELNQEEELLA